MYKKGLVNYIPKNAPKPINEYLTNDGPYITSYKLKHKLYNSKIKDEKCEVCGQGPIWNDKKLVLQLDHIDGNTRNNKLDNLQIVCPNCHTQTKTYAAKNKKNKKRQRKKYY